MNKQLLEVMQNAVKETVSDKKVGVASGGLDLISLINFCGQRNNFVETLLVKLSLIAEASIAIFKGTT